MGAHRRCVSEHWTHQGLSWISAPNHRQEAIYRFDRLRTGLRVDKVEDRRPVDMPLVPELGKRLHGVAARAALPTSQHAAVDAPAA